MTRHRSLVVAALVLAVGLTASPRAVARTDTLPPRLSDEEFWKIVEDFSEPNGYFQSDNLLSNEIWFQDVIPDLIARTKPGGVYLGVGPEQNFTYIAAHQTEDRLHHRHPARQSVDAPDVQGALRAVGQSRRVHVAAVQQAAAAGHRTEVHRGRDFKTRTGTRTPARAAVYDDERQGDRRSPRQEAQAAARAAGPSRAFTTRSTTTSTGSGRASRTARRMGAGAGNYMSYGDLMMATDGNGVVLGAIWPAKRTSGS